MNLASNAVGKPAFEGAFENSAHPQNMESPFLKNELETILLSENFNLTALTNQMVMVIMTAPISKCSYRYSMQNNDGAKRSVLYSDECLMTGKKINYV